jgi:hypothetical protein
LKTILTVCSLICVLIARPPQVLGQAARRQVLRPKINAKSAEEQGNKPSLETFLKNIEASFSSKESAQDAHLAPPPEVILERKWEELLAQQQQLHVEDVTAAFPVVQGDVLIQAGHRGRKTGKTGAETIYNGNRYREIDWTAVVADEATETLKKAGVSVIEKPAVLGIHERYKVTTAVYIHFDGSGSGTSGASVGYPAGSQTTANAWKTLYSEYWHYKWMQDNFTKNEAHYYAFGSVSPADGQILVELADMSSKDQMRWMDPPSLPKLKFQGQLLAYFLAERLNLNRTPGNQINIPKPILSH